MNYPQRNQSTNNRDNEKKKENMTLNEIKNKKLSQIAEKDFLVPDGYADKLAQSFKDINTNQIRNIYDQFLKANRENDSKKRERYLLQVYPLIAYAKGRNLITSDFYEFVKYLVDNIRNELDQFDKGFQFYQSLIAYLRYYSKCEVSK